MKQTIINEIDKYLTTLKAPLLMDGGDVNIVSFDKGTLELKVSGTCGSCPYFSITFNEGLEKKLKEKFPQIKKISYS